MPMGQISITASTHLDECSKSVGGSNGLYPLFPELMTIGSIFQLICKGAICFFYTTLWIVREIYRTFWTAQFIINIPGRFAKGIFVHVFYIRSAVCQINQSEWKLATFRSIAKEDFAEEKTGVSELFVASLQLPTNVRTATMTNIGLTCNILTDTLVWSSLSPRLHWIHPKGRFEFPMMVRKTL